MKNIGFTNDSDPIVEQIRPLLAGKPPDLVGMVLADLLAQLLAGFVSPDDADRATKVRDDILHWHTITVRELVKVYDDFRNRKEADASEVQARRH